MVAAVHIGNNGTEKVSVWWLVANYGVITIGELFLSPMGLSIVSKLFSKKHYSFNDGWMVFSDFHWK